MKSVRWSLVLIGVGILIKGIGNSIYQNFSLKYLIFMIVAGLLFIGAGLVIKRKH